MLVRNRSIKVKVEKESTNKVHLRLLSSNSKMIVDRSDYDKRLDNGTYELIK